MQGNHRRSSSLHNLGLANSTLARLKGAGQNPKHRAPPQIYRPSAALEPARHAARFNIRRNERIAAHQQNFTGFLGNGAVLEAARRIATAVTLLGKKRSRLQAASFQRARGTAFRWAGIRLANIAACKTRAFTKLEERSLLARQPIPLGVEKSPAAANYHQISPSSSGGPP